MNEAVSSLGVQLAAAADIILRNGWSDRDRLDRARLVLPTLPDPLPTAGRSKLAQYLVDQRVLTREQAQDLDGILRSQADMPGFQLLKKIGSGGMGVVYLAVHLASGRQCALKTLNTRLAAEQDFINRFHREAEALAGITHPNIAQVIESGEVDGHCFLAMEFIDGPSAMTLLRDYRAIPEAYALRIARQVAEGLAHAYSQTRLIHRDVKPENILMVRGPTKDGELFGEEDQAKIIDFGLVKSMQDDDQRLTQTGMTIGTPLYMSPEQVRGEALDCRSDIYGIGATLFHLLTGVTPFTGTSPGAIMSAHLTDPVPDPGARVPGLSADTRRLVMTCMAKSADQRFLTHDAVVMACDKALAGISGRGGDAPRLLLKPLVLKQARKPETAKLARIEETPEARRDVTSRIISKHREMQGGEAKVETSVTRSLARRSSHQNAAAPETAVAGDQQIGTVSELGGERPRLPPPLPQVAAVPDTALLAEAQAAAGQSARVGMLPLLALVAAVVALIAYLLFAR